MPGALDLVSSPVRHDKVVDLDGGAASPTESVVVFRSPTRKAPVSFMVLQRALLNIGATRPDKVVKLNITARRPQDSSAPGAQARKRRLEGALYMS